MIGTYVPVVGVGKTAACGRITPFIALLGDNNNAVTAIADGAVTIADNHDDELVVASTKGKRP